MTSLPHTSPTSPSPSPSSRGGAGGGVGASSTRGASWPGAFFPRLPLRVILASETGRTHLRRFVAREHAEENYSFWLESEHVRRLSPADVSTLQQRCEYIREKYLQVDASNEVTLDAEVRDTLCRAIEAREVDRFMFIEAQSSVFDALEMDALLRFWESDEYAHMVTVFARRCVDLLSFVQMPTKPNESRAGSVGSAAAVHPSLKPSASGNNLAGSAAGSISVHTSVSFWEVLRNPIFCHAFRCYLAGEAAADPELEPLLARVTAGSAGSDSSAAPSPSPAPSPAPSAASPGTLDDGNALCHMLECVQRINAFKARPRAAIEVQQDMVFFKRHFFSEHSPCQIALPADVRAALPTKHDPERQHRAAFDKVARFLLQHFESSLLPRFLASSTLLEWSAWCEEQAAKEVALPNAPGSGSDIDDSAGSATPSGSDDDDDASRLYPGERYRGARYGQDSLGHGHSHVTVTGGNVGAAAAPRRRSNSSNSGGAGPPDELPLPGREASNSVTQPHHWGYQLSQSQRPQHGSEASAILASLSPELRDKRLLLLDVLDDWELAFGFKDFVTGTASEAHLLFWAKAHEYELLPPHKQPSVAMSIWRLYLDRGAKLHLGCSGDVGRRVFARMSLENFDGIFAEARAIVIKHLLTTGTYDAFLDSSQYRGILKTRQREAAAAKRREFLRGLCGGLCCCCCASSADASASSPPPPSAQSSARNIASREQMEERSRLAASVSSEPVRDPNATPSRSTGARKVRRSQEAPGPGSDNTPVSSPPLSRLPSEESARPVPMRHLSVESLQASEDTPDHTPRPSWAEPEQE